LNRDPKIVVALDFADAGSALDLAGRLDPRRCRVKVGKELFTVAGPDLVRALVARDYEVFLDLKFHDIPHTVAAACRAAAGLGVWMMNVHASGGRRMMQAARDALGDHAQRPLLIAVTVLTSMDAEDLAEVGVALPPAQQVMHLATLAHGCGLDGVVCSAMEAGALRERFGAGFRLVTPGIRPAGAAHADQRRVMTPRAAIAAGATDLVIGRPITAAPDPLAVISSIEQQLQGSMQ
jgi:orotidine-5'-phosphate decarboxylase